MKDKRYEGQHATLETSDISNTDMEADGFYRGEWGEHDVILQCDEKSTFLLDVKRV